MHTVMGHNENIKYACLLCCSRELQNAITIFCAQHSFSCTLKITGPPFTGFPLLFCSFQGSLVRELTEVTASCQREGIGNLSKTTKYLSNTEILSGKKHAENLKCLNQLKINVSLGSPFSVLC